MLRRYLLPEEQSLLLKAAGASAAILARRDHAWMRAMMYSGERVFEFSCTTVGDAVSALQSKYKFIPKEVRKGKKRDHKVFVTAPLAAALRDLLAIRFEMTGEEHADPAAPLVVSRESAGGGRPMTVRSYQLRMKHWAHVAGLPPDVSPHWLRHTRAVNIMRNSSAKDPRGVVKSVLDHVSIGSTGIYTEVMREDVEQAMTTADGSNRKRISRKQLRDEFEARAK